MKKRERELLAAAHGRWLPKIAGLKRVFAVETGNCWWLDDGPQFPHKTSIEAHFQRGFLSDITCTASDFLTHADALTAAQPIQAVKLTTWPGRVDNGMRILQPEWSTSGNMEFRFPVSEQARHVKSVLSRWNRITFTLPQFYAEAAPRDESGRFVMQGT